MIDKFGIPKIISLLLLSALFILFSTHPLEAKPLRQSSTTLIRVCFGNTSCTNPNNTNTNYNITLSGYVQQVLANEWPSDAGIAASKAGAIAIRTFAYRTSPCGAYIGNYTESSGPPPTISRLVTNVAQAYRLGSTPTSPQNTITANQSLAEAQTDLLVLYRTDNTFACAKHKTDVGNPTLACVAGACTNDTTDQNTLSSVPDPVSVTATPNVEGMGQNGSKAWAWSQNSAKPWDYRQILSHYYKEVKIGSSDNNDYRWVWLNIGNPTFTSPTTGRQYYIPVARTPNTMGVNQVYWVPLRIQNTGDTTWVKDGANPVHVSYHWDNSNGTVVWEGRRTTLAQNVSPGGEIYVNAQVLAPPLTGAYTLKWDLVKEGVTWFSQQNNWPTQNVSVQVQNSTLYEILWSNDQGWQRTYPIVNSLPGAASGWTSIPSTSTDFPPGGTMLTQNSYIVHDTYIQGYWRGNTEAVAEGHTPSTQIANGALGTLSGWSMPALFLTTSGLPGSGLIQTQNNFVEGTQLRQGYWRNNIGYGRVVPIFDGRVLWTSAPATWNTFTLSDTWPPNSSGALESQSGYVLGDIFYQVLWRGGRRWSRSLQITNGVLTNTVLSDWQDTTATANLPSGSSGAVQAHTHYVLP